MKQSDTRRSLGLDPSIDSLCSSVSTSDRTAWLSVDDNRNTPRTEDTEALEWTTHWSEGGTESSSTEKLRFLGMWETCVRVFGVRITESYSFPFRCTQFRRRRDLCLVLLTKHSLFLMSLILQWSEVAWGDEDPAALWWNILPCGHLWNSPGISSLLLPVWLMRLSQRNKHRMSSGTHVPWKCPKKIFQDN